MPEVWRKMLKEDAVPMVVTSCRDSRLSTVLDGGFVQLALDDYKGRDDPMQVFFFTVVDQFCEVQAVGCIQANHANANNVISGICQRRGNQYE